MTIEVVLLENCCLLKVHSGWCLVPTVGVAILTDVRRERKLVSLLLESLAGPTTPLRADSGVQGAASRAQVSEPERLWSTWDWHYPKAGLDCWLMSS